MSTTDSTPLLRVEDLSVDYHVDGVDSSAVRSVSFDIERGRTLAMVGQSGSGKSTIANTVFRLLSSEDSTARGHVWFDGVDVLPLSDEQFRQLRGQRIGYVPQDPVTALNPVRKIGGQVTEALKTWGDEKSGSFASQALALLAQVHLSDPQRVFDAYPHQLSGGMLQRVLIAIAISGDPDLLIADEPTSALDATVAHTILDLIDTLRAERDLAVLLITHDLSIARDRSSTVVVLHDGTVVEAGDVGPVFDRPSHPYTASLLADVPALDPDKYRERRAGREGSLPAVDIRSVGKIFGRGRRAVEVLDDVSITVRAGSTHALVGESGSGKSTTARILLRLEEQTSGTVVVSGKTITGSKHRDLRELRRNLQLVYQNPFTSLDPRFTVRDSIEEPLRRYKIGSSSTRNDRVGSLVESVGLLPRHLDVRPSSLSGGQRQRVAIARALALDPEILVLDEPTSALDVTVQAQILDLLVDLQIEKNLTYLFISHDLSVVRQFADDVTVLRAGVVVESGTTNTIFDSPTQQYTRELLRSVPGRTESRAVVTAGTA